MKIKQKSPVKLWDTFREKENLSQEQLEKFQTYANFLVQKNKEYNLTAITDLAGMLRQHFQDSLVLRNFIDVSKLNLIVDIGAGAGFPAVPLKIMFPELKVILIEVTKKKQRFLYELVDLLGLHDVEVCEYDWRTFLRIVEADVDLFVTRAALKESELIRAFKPGCRYKNTDIVYWASRTWEPEEKTQSFVKRTEHYKLGYRERQLVFLGL